MPFRIHHMLFMMKETIKTRTVPGAVVQLRMDLAACRGMGIDAGKIFKAC